jgi:NAD-dependent histone deacetylase SIR2
LLNLIFTQNIDALELKAGVPREKIVFAHGNILEAHCSKCHTDYDIKMQQTHIKEGKVLICTEPDCNAPCKPKVVFYGESLPKDFFNKMDGFSESDCGIIMGTSLKVMPFNLLPYKLHKSTWRVVINNERVGEEKGSSGFYYDDVTSPDLFLEGSIDDQCMKIIKDLGWKDEYEEYVKKIQEQIKEA